MGLFDKAKKRALGIIDEDAREQVREENQIERDNKTVDRYEKEIALKQRNMDERLERRKMLSGEKPLSMREFGKSKLRESGNNLRISSLNTFNRENVGMEVKAGAKKTGQLFKAGAKRAAEYERRYEARQAKEPRRQKQSSFGFDYLTEHPQNSYDIQQRYIGPRKGQKQPSASDITSSLLGSSSGPRKKGSKKKSKEYDPFDFSGYLE